MKAKSILVVDDEKLVCLALTKELEEGGYHVDSVQSGVKAIQKVKNKRFDLIFLDLVMPGIDGIETCRKIKEITPDTEVICFTGTIDDSLMSRQIEFIQAGGRLYFLYKPFKEGYIKETARKALAS